MICEERRSIPWNETPLCISVEIDNKQPSISCLCRQHYKEEKTFFGLLLLLKGSFGTEGKICWLVVLLAVDKDKRYQAFVKFNIQWVWLSISWNKLPFQPIRMKGNKWWPIADPETIFANHSVGTESGNIYAKNFSQYETT